jgi:hypothetical protein
MGDEHLGVGMACRATASAAAGMIIKLIACNLLPIEW